MKKTLACIFIASALSLLPGCGTTQITKEQACSYAVTAYGVYLAVINANGTPTEEQIMAAQAAAVVLETQCGWSPAAVGKTVLKVKVLDCNQVPVIVP